MNISTINLNNFKFQNIKQNKIQKQTNSIQNKNLLYPTTAQYLAFLGGYSVNLAQTFDKLEDSQYPSDIQEIVLAEIENGNPDSKTLYDIHFEKYKGILDCYSLDELKEKYPEFKNVKSAFEVSTKSDSFIGKFQNGENEIFQTNEDLSLQLIKLYWGQGFSLNGLSDYIANLSQDKKGIQLNHTLEKLNIPLMNKRYANVLRLSNKEYNEKFTCEMSKRLKEAKEIKKQQQEGEPVYIPKGPMPESQKEHISQGLKRHYQEHPEKIFEMSERQKEFYRQHPELAKEMSIVMLYAWHETKEGQNLAKHISKFAKKYNGSIITIEELSNKKPMNNKGSQALSAFWKINTWARKQMSIAVTKGYKHLDELKANPKEDKKQTMAEKLGYTTIPNERYTFSNIPTQIRTMLNTWVKEQGLNPDDYVFALGVLYSKDKELENVQLQKQVDEKSCALMAQFFETQPYLDDLMANAYELAIVDIMETLKDPSQKYKLPKSLRADFQKTMLLGLMAEEFTKTQPLYRKTPNGIYYTPGITKEYLNQIQQDLIQFASTLGCEDFIDYFQKTVDKKFNECSKKRFIGMN